MVPLKLPRLQIPATCPRSIHGRQTFTTRRKPQAAKVHGRKLRRHRFGSVIQAVERTPFLQKPCLFFAEEWLGATPSGKKERSVVRKSCQAAIFVGKRPD